MRTGVSYYHHILENEAMVWAVDTPSSPRFVSLEKLPVLQVLWFGVSAPMLGSGSWSGHNQPRVLQHVHRPLWAASITGTGTRPRRSGRCEGDVM